MHTSFDDKKHKGMVFNIQKYSVHDGPGIRTLVFLKGCPLSCRWCSNPESQSTQPEIAYNAGRCFTVPQCERCFTACPNNALTRNADRTICIDRSLCQSCPTLCAKACPAQGIIAYGQEQSVEDIMRVVEQDAAFYIRSGGGMTLSGGEPLLQADFATALLREARRRRIKTALETCGQVPWSSLAGAAPHLTSALYDIKTTNIQKHTEHTGRANTLVLENFSKLVTEFPNLPVLARTPIVPGFNDTVEDARAIALFLQPFSHVTWELLPYHRLGTQKYTFLGRTPPMGDVTLPKERMEPLYEAAKEVLGARAHIAK